ncbi:MAG: hypothetical protein M3P13_03445 [Acidobacteriota bacterium]|nr:hypothetical protein [Acidobacteriota bacterium]
MTTGVVLAGAMMMAAPAVAGAQTPIRTTVDQQQRQEKISIMEGTLTSSVGVAAQRVAKDVKSIDSTAMLFAGTARAKGFMLEGHGVFFYVEVPTLDLSVMMTVQQFERSAQQRAEAQQQQPPAGDAQQVNNLRPDAPAQPLPTAVESLANLAAEGQKWRATVRLALIDAMLDNSKNLELKPDEWLTIAARGSETDLMPNEILNLTTTVLRVKGSDLADFLAGKLTKEEARLKVEVREF